METEHLIVKALQVKDKEEAYFKEQDRKRIEKLRKANARESNEKYREEHRYHCFRCGTPSLVEIEEGNVNIDICVNEGCGAVHLDAGELDRIKGITNRIASARKALSSVFK